jgi:hypothetical protein
MKRCMVGVLLTVLLVAVSLSGCQENTGDEGTQTPINSGFIGRWLNIDTSPDNETWTFFTNGTVEYSVSQLFEGSFINSTSWFNYVVETDTLCLSSIEVSPETPSSYSECYGYAFSDNDSSLTLTFNGTIAFVLAKIKLS